jgi:gluconolactonase
VAEIRVLAGDLDHPEGIAWDPARGALIAGGEAGQLYRIDPAGGGVETIAETGGAVLGIAIDGASRIVWCDQARAAVMRFDPGDGSVTTVSTGAPGQPFRVPNHLVFDARGRLYVSESGSWPDRDGSILAIEPDGLTAVLTPSTYGFANGLAIDPSGGWLYVVETSNALITRLAIGADGSLDAREVVVEMPGTVPDGLAFAADGTLLISCFRPDAIHTWDGRTLGLLVADPTGISLSAPTNLTFFGPGLERLATANIAFRHVSEIVSDLRGAPLRYPTP